MDLFDIEKRPHKSTPLSLRERQFIEKQIKKNISLSSIGVMLKRGKNTVITEVRRYGGRDKYNANNAHKLAQEKNEERIKKTTNSLKKSSFNPYISLSEKIKILEMQIEILFDTIKEMKNDKQN